MTASVWQDLNELGMDRSLTPLVEQINERGRRLGQEIADVADTPSGGSAVDVEEDDAVIVTGASSIDFLGDDFDVADAGGGQADVSLAATVLKSDESWTQTVSVDFDATVTFNSATEFKGAANRASQNQNEVRVDLEAIIFDRSLGTAENPIGFVRAADNTLALATFDKDTGGIFRKVAYDKDVDAFFPWNDNQTILGKESPGISRWQKILAFDQRLYGFLSIGPSSPEPPFGSVLLELFDTAPRQVFYEKDQASGDARGWDFFVQDRKFQVRSLNGTDVGNVIAVDIHRDTDENLLRLKIPSCPLFYNVPGSAPADVDLDPNEVVAWLDEAADELVFKVKYSGGGVKSGTVALV